jgi:hypothetical protein
MKWSLFPFWPLAEQISPEIDTYFTSAIRPEAELPP